MIPSNEPYDAPRWISTERPVYLRELVDNVQNMAISGVWHEALNITFRAAPDLFLWDGDTIPLNISYRFPTESWIDEDNSFLNVTFNNQYLKDLPVNKEGFLERIWYKLGGDTRKELAHIPIERHMIYGDNQLSLFFDITNMPKTPCAALLTTNIKSRIGEDSQIDLSKTSHFSLLPNLSFFVGASFPFTKLADFSDTVILLPKQPDDRQIQTLLNLVARSGKATGTVAANNTVYLGIPVNLAQLESKDILAVSTIDDKSFNQRLLTDSPFTTQRNRLSIRELTTTQKLMNWIEGYWNLTNIEADRYFSSLRSWRGFLSYRSPWDSERLVVLATASDNEQLSHLGKDLQSNTINAAIRGDTSIITDEQGVHSFQVAPQFPSGQLPWYNMVVWYANQHSGMLAILTAIAAIILGLALHSILVQRAHKRLNPESEKKQKQ